ncbi:zinc finger protein 638-like [Cheilinus undulatus]|uniref:zinc finger protein 638-like n=1 Tax=Cheilinus undulatus TaxID=241271 RepID=UPI001BD2FE10|nr:zinc finger protein 638-like [Cheilinus undulatus]XP_041634856.1 zinc finger protein 638-like [Cheilinus undulatus]XP_041634857.1 zinc finger protein 638-like [Cheilinus undulatus]XP_041634858.1 zinc finger protein 638-like [Cheilinus undulatus]
MRPQSKSIHQPMDHGPLFTGTHKEDLHSLGREMASNPMTPTSATLRHKHEGKTESSSRTLDWLLKYVRPLDDGSSLKTSTFLNSASCDDGRLNGSDNREHNTQYIPGLGDYDFPASDEPDTSTETRKPKFTPEQTARILLHFGLEREDLEVLISYPEDQITHANLPVILDHLHLQKKKKATTEVQSEPCLEPQPNRTVSGPDIHNRNSSGRAVMQLEKTSKTTNYLRTGEGSARVEDDVGRTSNSGSGKMFESQEPLPKRTTEFKSSAVGPSNKQLSSFYSLSSLYSPVLCPAYPRNDQTKKLLVQPKQYFQDILCSSSQPMKDTSFLDSETPKPVPLDQSWSAFITQPPVIHAHGMHHHQTDLGPFGSNDTSGTNDPSEVIPVESSMKQKGNQREQLQQQSVQHTSNPIKLLTLLKKTTGKSAVFKDKSAPEMVSDRAATPSNNSPRTCVLCTKECTDTKEWISHLSSYLHLENLRLFRKQYTNWDGETNPEPRPVAEYAKPHSSASSKKTSHFHSRSLRPHSQHGPKGRLDRCRSRSDSPLSTRNNCRSRSQSSERQSSPRRRVDRRSLRGDLDRQKRSSPQQKRPNRLSNKLQTIRLGNRPCSKPLSPHHHGRMRRRHRRRSQSPPSPRYNHRHDSPAFYSNRSHSQSPERWSSQRRVIESESQSPPRRNRRSRETSPPKPKGSNSTQTLLQSDLEDVIKTAAPSFLAELAKMALWSSSSSISTGEKQLPSLPADYRLPELKPINPLCEEFVVPAYFCNLCFVYCHESNAKELHCSSQTHLDNLQMNQDLQRTNIKL